MKQHKKAISSIALGPGGAFMLIAPAFAATAHTTNGYAYNTGSYKVTIVDTAKDTHQVESQTYLKGSSNVRYLLRAGDANWASASARYDRKIDHFRACRLMMFDQCSWYKYL